MGSEVRAVQGGALKKLLVTIPKESPLWLSGSQSFSLAPWPALACLRVSLHKPVGLAAAGPTATRTHRVLGWTGLGHRAGTRGSGLYPALLRAWWDFFHEETDRDGTLEGNLLILHQ